MPAIVRAFTTRRVKMSVDLAQESRESREKTTTPRSNTRKLLSSRSNTVANEASRPQISAPIELIHTTNMLSYNAPDLPRPSTSSQGSVKSSTNTHNDSDSSLGTAASSPPTSPDVSPSELKRPLSPEPNHLSSYFMNPQQAQGAAQASVAAPAIPQRAPSHTKQSSMDAISRQRSTSHLQKPMGRSNSSARSPTSPVAPSRMSHRSFISQSSTSSSGPVSTHSSVPMPAPSPHDSSQHPFGAELARVTEMAEEFGGTERIGLIDDEERELISRGLCKLSADVYLHDIQTLAALFFHDRDVRYSRPAPAVWI